MCLTDMDARARRPVEALPRKSAPERPLRSGADESRNRTRPHDPARDRGAEEIAERTVALGAHHQQPGAGVPDPLQEDVGGRCGRDDGMQPMWGPLRGQVLARQVDQRLGLGAVAVDAQHLDDLAGGKPEKLERLERARGLSSTPVGQENALSLRNRAGERRPPVEGCRARPGRASRRAAPGSRSGSASPARG